MGTPDAARHAVGFFLVTLGEKYLELFASAVRPTLAADVSARTAPKKTAQAPQNGQTEANRGGGGGNNWGGGGAGGGGGGGGRGGGGGGGGRGGGGGGGERRIHMDTPVFLHVQKPIQNTA